MPNATDRLKTERSAPLRLPVHPDAARTESFQRWVARQKRPLAIDLFSGCGGLSAGLEQAGYTVVLSVDNDPWALETHRHNLPGTAINLDLSDPDEVNVVLRLLEGISVDLVAGGPPCQPFSRAGRPKLRDLVRGGVRSAKDERSELWQTFISIAERLRPAAVMLENVPDMALGDELIIARTMTDRLEKAGYDVQMRLVVSWRLGVPQHRQRFILVALRDGQEFAWPPDQKKITLREAIGDLPSLRGGRGKLEMPARLPSSPFQKRARSGMNGTAAVVFDHVTRPVRADDREAFRLMKPGTRYGDLPEHLRRYRDDIFDDKYNRLAWDDVSRAITAHIAKDGYWYIHPSELRTLTVREAARIQTFPDHFRFAGTRSHAFRQIGNAVPVALAEAIGRQITRALRARPIPVRKRAVNSVDRMRAALLKWGRRDSTTAPWRHPGQPWSVLAGVCLGDRNGGRDSKVQSFLERFPRPTASASRMIALEAKRESGNWRESLRALARTARVVAADKRAWSNGAWARAADLGSSDEAAVRAIGLNEDRILSSTPLLRVVARLTGSRVDQKSRFSDGRLIVAKLVGTGSDVPALNAALHAIGRVLCAPKDPKCSQCPVASYCATRLNG